jgi:hypothetical protein
VWVADCHLVSKHQRLVRKREPEKKRRTVVPSGWARCTSRGHRQVAYSLASIKVCLSLGHPQRVATHRPHSGRS